MLFLAAYYVTIDHICMVVIIELKGNHSGRTVGLLQVLPLSFIVLWRGKACSWILVFP